MIAVEEMLYVRYQAPDLEAMENCLTHFGLHRTERTDKRLYMRGAGRSPVIHVTELGEAKSVGYGLAAQSRADLDVLARATGQPVQARDEPGGGSVVRLTDPAGYRVDVVWGIEPVTALYVPPPLPFNAVQSGSRCNQPVRRGMHPSNVARLGHVAAKTPDLAACIRFYQDLLGFRIADEFLTSEGKRAGVFMRCGLGQRFTDHHTMALLGHPSPGFDHAGFEVPDWDDLMGGHYHLMSQPSIKHSWGVGRHNEGSNLFDYWCDPWGHKLEHWADMDRVNDDYRGGSEVLRLDGVALRQWAPAFDPKFFE